MLQREKMGIFDLMKSHHRSTMPPGPRSDDCVDKFSPAPACPSHRSAPIKTYTECSRERIKQIIKITRFTSSSERIEAHHCFNVVVPPFSLVINLWWWKLLLYIHNSPSTALVGWCKNIFRVWYFLMNIENFVEISKREKYVRSAAKKLAKKYLYPCQVNSYVTLCGKNIFPKKKTERVLVAHIERVCGVMCQYAVAWMWNPESCKWYQNVDYSFFSIHYLSDMNADGFWVWGGKIERCCRVCEENIIELCMNVWILLRLFLGIFLLTIVIIWLIIWSREIIGWLAIMWNRA